MTRRLLLTVPVVTVLALTGCSSSGSGDGGSAAAQPAESAATTITVTSTDNACTLSSDSSAPGPLTFSVRNDGSDVTEFYLYQTDGTTIVGEVEDVTPGLTRDLSIDATEGAYIAACKPSSGSEGIRVAFTVQ